MTISNERMVSVDLDRVGEFGYGGYTVRRVGAYGFLVIEDDLGPVTTEGIAGYWTDPEDTMDAIDRLNSKSQREGGKQE